MVNFGEKAKVEKAGNFNSGRNYVITTVSKNLGVGVDFLPGSEGDFLTGRP